MEHFSGLKLFRLAYVSKRRRLILLLQVVAMAGLFFGLNSSAFVSTFPGLTSALWALAIFVTAHFGLSVVRIVFVASYRARLRLAQDDQDNFTLALSSLVSVLSILIGVAGFFYAYEIDFLQVWTSFALFSVATAWIAKEYITNFIDSFILMFSTDYRIGEYIKINEDQKGIIKDITFRATKIRTDEGDTLYIPNTILLNEEVTNYSKTKWKRITVPFSMFRNRVSDVTAFEARLVNELRKAFPDLIEDQKVYLRIHKITNDSVDMSLEVSVSTYNFRIEEDITKWVSVYVLAQP